MNNIVSDDSPVEKTDSTDSKNHSDQVEKTNPSAKKKPILNKSLNILIDKEGNWFHNNQQIKRKGILKYFSSLLHCDRQGSYWLISSREKVAITVEDVPFIAVELEVIGNGKSQTLIFRTNADEFISLDKSHPLRIEINSKTLEPAPYIGVRKNLEAKITRSLFYQLVNLGSEKIISGEKIIGIWSSGTFFRIGKSD
ncbi:MAG: DUF1285 domain-containing protein [Pseudomonadota bacterium]|nr:DUF1285 domain-containing protein [Pseudomonadota bacterium]